MRLTPPSSEPPGIAAAVLWLPDQRLPAARAVADGRLDQETADRLGYRSLTASSERAAPEMAVLAAQKALAEAGWAGEDLGLVVHSWIYHQGHDFWSPPHFIAHGIGASAATPLGVRQTSNGGIAGIEVAAGRLALDPSVSRCVVTTADRFAPPGFDRWYGDIDVAYGDGATALLLDRGGGPYSLLSVASVSAPEYEILYRGEDAFSAAPRTPHATVSARRTKTAFRAGGGWPRFVGVLRRAVQRVVRDAVADAGLTPDDPRLRFVVLPRLSTGALTQYYGPSVRELPLPHTEILDLGRDTGHLGAGDPVANLADLHADARLAPGEVALLLSAGNGFTWSCLAVRRE
ncbi:ketoacyl-ACP synthase III family protein [Streptomyces sp. N2-109]|uniref:Ketoacyl-ACP synthase III family protein n=1 Tax=Streptomyces gossypii TaxID=2883101 RepID=A0ABT2JUE9_9ACTN|nr:ketoacyl-ACP synthase III family protein [Streptomyces gossypii]MCT2590995.1 ketoacyl-ACP synthase III family protein [Streptomyces gossypii]